jgi:hypothetical protein
MPVEFALRPRIRLRDELAPPRRSRLQLPRFMLPVAAYWLAVSGIVYAFVHSHEPAHPPQSDEPALNRALEPEPALQPERALQPEPAPTLDRALEPEPTPQAERAFQPDPSPALDRALEPEPTTQAERALQPEPTSQADPRRTPRGGAAALPRTAVPPLSEAALPVAAEIPTASPPSFSGSRDSRAFPSCENAIASANQGIDFSSGNAADLTTEAIAAVLNGPWIQSCNVPEKSAVEVCVAIHGGSVVGASVATRPSDAGLNACVKHRARALQFPYSSRTDIARTRF